MRQFSILPDNMETLNFQIRSYSRSSIQPWDKEVLHLHPHTEILFITEGRGFICIQGKKIHVYPGIVLVVKPETKHMIQADKDEHVAYASVGVLQVVFDRKKDLAAEEDGVYCLDFSVQFDKLFNYLREIEREYHLKQEFWQYEINSQLNSFVVFILRSFHFSVRAVEWKGGSNVATMIRSYIFAHCQEDLTLESIARHFNLSKYYIAHVYKREYGTSIINSLNKFRCQEAKNALEGADSSITEIASLVGFNSVAHFSETYKKIYGVSPKEARKQFSKEKT